MTDLHARAARLTRRQLLWRTALGLALPSAAALLAACGQSAPPPVNKPSVLAPTTAPAPAAAASPAAAPPAAEVAPAKSGEPPAPLTMAATGNIQTAMFPIGVEKGMFLKQNIDLKVRTLNSGTEGIKAVQAGEAQFASLAFATMSSARAQDIKVKAIWVSTSDPFVAKSDDVEAIVATANSGITKVEDLVGKKIGTTIGVAPDFYLRAVLAKAGIDLNKVELVNVQPSNMLAGLQSGLDAISASEPYPELALARLPGSCLVVRDGGYVAQRGTVSALEDWIAANRPLAERFDAAIAEATQFLRKNPDESAEIASRYLPGIEVPILRKAIGHLSLDPRMSPALRAGWESEIGDLVQRGTLKQTIPFEDGVEVALIESVIQKYPMFFDDLKPLT